MGPELAAAARIIVALREAKEEYDAQAKGAAEAEKAYSAKEDHLMKKP